MTAFISIDFKCRLFSMFKALPDYIVITRYAEAAGRFTQIFASTYSIQLTTCLDQFKIDSKGETVVLS